MSLWDIFQAFIPLILIVALLYGVLLLVRKYGRNIKGNNSSPLSINVVESKMIMPKKFISVVKIEDKLLVLGVSEQSITLLKELEFTAEYQSNISANDQDNFLN